MGRSWEVLVFPRYGTRYHVPGCMYVKDTEKKKWRTTSMQKKKLSEEDIRRAGYAEVLLLFDKVKVLFKERIWDIRKKPKSYRGRMQRYIASEHS